MGGRKTMNTRARRDDMNYHYDTVLSSLTTLVMSGNPDSFTVFLVDVTKNYYVQFLYDREHSTLHGETVGNDFVPSGHRLGPEQLAWLSGKGWLRGKSGSFIRQWGIRRDQTLHPVALETAGLFREVFGVDATAPITVETEQEGSRESVVVIPGTGTVSVSDEMPVLQGSTAQGSSFCPRCGAPLLEQSAFCSQCGSSL
jgi:hypothetical protein